MFDLSKKKKKVPKKKEAAGEDGDDDFDGLESGAAASSRGGPPADEKRVFLDASEGGCGDYSYEQMLDRIMDMLNANNPELMEKRRHTMKPPQLMRVGTKKTLWVNFSVRSPLLLPPLSAPGRPVSDASRSRARSFSSTTFCASIASRSFCARERELPSSALSCCALARCSYHAC